MTSIKYIGPHDAVDVPGFGTVTHGQAVDVPEPLAASLLEQTDNYTAAKSAKIKEA